jgi:hypothetical protein
MTTTPNTTDLRNLLRALRNAGWHHTAKWEDRKGRDADGAPNGEDTEVHRWSRGDAYIEVPRDTQGQIEWHILYEPYGDFTDYEFSFITVGAHWVEQHEGIPGLHRLACALGILPAELSSAVGHLTAMTDLHDAKHLDWRAADNARQRLLVERENLRADLQLAQAEVERLRKANANLIRNAEILADEIVSGTRPVVSR